MAKAIALLFALSVLILTVHLSAQQPDDRLAALRTSSKVRLLEAPGPVPILYVPSAESRAVQIQKAVEAAYAWYEKQLHLHAPVTIYVLDKDMWGRFGGSNYPLPFTRSGPTGQIVMPDVGDANQVVFPGLYHELGHVYAYPLNIRSGNQFVNEFVAQIFAAGYLRAENLTLVLQSPPDRYPAGASPRYTSLADLDYLYEGVGADNYLWFQDQLGKLADYLVKDQSFPAIIEKLQAAFPAGKAKHETLEEIDVHLETIRPGFKAMAGSLAGTSTITRIKPSACKSASETGAASTMSSFIVVQNDTADPLAVAFPAGNKFNVSAHDYVTRQISVGASLKLPDGTCLVGRDEPTLAVIEKQ
jgi:hypothetical protein